MAENLKLKPLLSGIGKPVFAVLDGAQFDDLPNALFEGDFVYRSLYLDRGNGTADQLKTAPQLVWLDRDTRLYRRDDDYDDFSPDSALLDRLLTLIDERPAVVFWVCDAGGKALYRHLRGINKVLLPSSANIDRGKSYERDPLARAPNQPNQVGHDMVLFRHCDANVMAQVLPSLTYVNMSRVLGPASQILYSADADWGDKPLRLNRGEDMPLSPPGPLKLSINEMQAIEKRRQSAARLRRRIYLKQTCPEETAGATNEAIEEHLRVSEETGKKLGLVSEGAQFRWAFMMCKTNGRIAQSPEALEFITTRGSSPDEQVKLFMRGITGALAAGDRA